MPKLIEPRPNRLPIVLALLFLLVGYGAYHYRGVLFPHHPPAVTPPLAQEGEMHPPPAIAPAPATPEATPPAPLAPSQLAQQVRDFFTHLDGQEYIRAHQLKGGSLVYLGQLLAQALAHPPAVAGRATDNLATIKNGAHLYHVLGGQNLALLKEIALHEQETLESFLATFYAWSRLPAADQQGADLPLQLPLKPAYEYACFFLDTIGGQSYLLRRPPTLRLLGQYYALRLVAQAEQESLNRHRIATDHAAGRLRQEISANASLANKEEYLATIEGLGGK